MADGRPCVRLCAWHGGARKGVRSETPARQCFLHFSTRQWRDLGAVREWTGKHFGVVLGAGIMMLVVGVRLWWVGMGYREAWLPLVP